MNCLIYNALENNVKYWKFPSALGHNFDFLFCLSLHSKDIQFSMVQNREKQKTLMSDRLEWFSFLPWVAWRLNVEIVIK